MPWKFTIFAALVLASVLSLSSCRERSPLAIDKPPIIREYHPTSLEIPVLVGDTLRFGIDAYDPENNGLSYRYLLADSLVSTDSVWAYVIDDTGRVAVEGVVNDGLNETKVCWWLTREMPLNRPPIMTYYSPEDLYPSVILGDSIEFAITAVDPEGESILYRFAVDDQVMSYSRRFVYVSTHLGLVQVAGIASDGERASSVIWKVDVTAKPDSILPATVKIVSARTGTEPGEIEIEWIAVGDDGMEGLPSVYVARTSSVPITSEWHWERATDRSGEPPPAAPGDTMGAVIRGLIPANLVYVSVRAQDEFGNLSPLGNSPGAWVKGLEVTGTVRNAVSGFGIEGIVVDIAGRRDTTDAGGSFEFTELPQEKTKIILKDEFDPAELGAYYDLDSAYTAKHLDRLELWLIPNQPFHEPCNTINSGDSTYYTGFLHFFRVMADLDNHPFGNIVRRWSPPADIYVPGGVFNGIDYEAEVLDAIADWNGLTGMALFAPVGAPPDIGLTVAYEDSGFNDGREFYEVMEFDEDWVPVKGTIHLIKDYNGGDPLSLVALRRVIRHELGHALGLRHSACTNHLMIGGISQQVDLPSPDEIDLVRCLYNLPRGESIANHLLD